MGTKTLLAVLGAAIIYRIIAFLAVLGVSIYFFWLYNTHHDEYCKRDIALWLVVTGATTVATLLLETIATCALSSPDDDEEQKKKNGAKRSMFLSPLYLFSFAWFIVGNVWVFKTDEDECDELVYKTGFWYLITLYIIAGVSMLLGCCLVCCTLVIASKKKQDIDV